ncbi:beta-propeller fold lactonase family protein [Paenibacillus thalictri]|uniref:Lactonase family protein n=1 Tax=Paenibacillus thalictri TaxID=2527873 RepID=A0A4Q9DZD9_9BACL|nr:hypothetical protein [Paenibacillus thalictri]TBL80641.1 hypothetical protein EYB31_05270 [Paenibacillus thalictri]
MFSKLLSMDHSPVAEIYTPDSILSHSKITFRNTELTKGKIRYSTCTDVAWINKDRYLAVLNYAAESLHIYAFDRLKHTASPIQSLNNQNGMQLHEPDKFAFSPNGLYMAVTNNKAGSSSVNLYQMDPRSSLVHPVPFGVIKASDYRFHGVAFSNNSQYMVSTVTSDQGLIYLHKLIPQAHGAVKPELEQTVQNGYFPLKPKSINFSQDGSLMVVCFSSTPGKESPTSNGGIAIYSFDQQNGIVGTEPLCELIGNPEMAFTDDVAFSCDAASSYIAMTSQANDSIVFYPFDRKANQINPQFFALSNPQAKISFPHGLALSSDNQYLAVSNYGDDKVTVYSLNGEAKRQG